LLATTVLAAKNAILIVEFAEAEWRRDIAARDVVLRAARLRLGPILVTSLAFIAGVFRLVVASGAGEGRQNDTGTGVVAAWSRAWCLRTYSPRSSS
jgi:multidrug efflux pump subunit AcrB